jgi:hypothetical protein
MCGLMSSAGADQGEGAAERQRAQTEQLLVEQARREALEVAHAQAAQDAEEERQHVRRAQKAGYLREALARRAASERDS